ncbi:MAG: hypothetical protein AAGG81_04315 [Chlamydiota bacterium]
MRSYYSHLEQVKDTLALNESKPVFRASAIFPAIHRKRIHTRLIFLSYWLLKRSLQEITCLVTLRCQEGRVVHRTMETINDPRSYRVELVDLIISCGLDVDNIFVGSLEIEFFSSKPLVYPFPAVTVNYYGPDCSTFVHTAQRIYNDYEDMMTNSQQHVPEAGFNIHVNPNTEPLIGLINGPVDDHQVSLDFEFINSDNEVLKHEFILGALAPYETQMIYPARELDLNTFLQGRVGTMKVSFDIPWIFPRLIVGNVRDKPISMSITHSYYDCSAATQKSDYWITPEEGWYSAALSVPVQVKGEEKRTNIYFYPIYTPSDFTLDLHIYDRKGNLVYKREEVVAVQSSVGEYYCLSLNEILGDIDTSNYEDLSAHLIAKTNKNHKIPARVKISVDICHDEGLPCNICTNLVPFNPEWKNKERTFRWLPLLADQKRCSVWILNNSLKVEHNEETQAILSFYRESDTRTIVREVFIPANGYLVIRPDEDDELTDFLQDTIGWVTVDIANPYVTTYYLAENPSGNIGGDHGY